MRPTPFQLKNKPPFSFLVLSRKTEIAGTMGIFNQTPRIGEPYTISNSGDRRAYSSGPTFGGDTWSSSFEFIIGLSRDSNSTESGDISDAIPGEDTTVFSSPYSLSDYDAYIQGQFPDFPAWGPSDPQSHRGASFGDGFLAGDASKSQWKMRFLAPYDYFKVWWDEVKTEINGDGDPVVTTTPKSWEWIPVPLPDRTADLNDQQNWFESEVFDVLSPAISIPSDPVYNQVRIVLKNFRFSCVRNYEPSADGSQLNGFPG